MKRGKGGLALYSSECLCGKLSGKGDGLRDVALKMKRGEGWVLYISGYLGGWLSGKGGGLGCHRESFFSYRGFAQGSCGEGGSLKGTFLQAFWFVYGIESTTLSWRCL